MQREGSGYLGLQQHICSKKEESDILLLLRSVFSFIGMATGLHEAEEWVEREKRDRLGETDGLGSMKSTKTKQTTTKTTTTITITKTVTMIAIVTIIA